MTERVLPLSGHNFRVVVAIAGPRGGQVRLREVAVSRVMLPSFRLEGAPWEPHDSRSDDVDPSTFLRLQRGHTGSAEFWNLYRADRDKLKRTVQLVAVDLFDEAGRPATRWEFTGCRVVGLDLTPLDATESALLMETLVVAFDEAEQKALTQR